MDPYELVPDELIVEQALALESADIKALSQTSTRFNRICKSAEFWRQKYIRDFGNDDWKTMYENRRLMSDVDLIVFEDKEPSDKLAYDLGKTGNIGLAMGLFTNHRHYIDLIIGYTNCPTVTVKKLRKLVHYVMWSYDPIYDDTLRLLIKEVVKDDHLVVILEEIRSMIDKCDEALVDMNTIDPKRWDAIKHLFG